MLAVTLALSLAATALPAVAFAAEEREEPAPSSAGDDDGGAAQRKPADAESAPTERQAYRIAKAHDHPVEVESESSRRRTLMIHPDGSHSQRVHPGTVRVPVPGSPGRWQPVNTTLSGVRGRLAAAAVDGSLTFAGEGGGAAVVVERDDWRLAMRWPGELPPPEADGAVARYSDVLPDTDLELEAQVSGFMKRIVVSSAAAVRDSYDLVLDLDALDVNVREDGAMVFRDRVGKRVLVGSKPLMWDAERNDAGDPIRFGEVDIRVRKVRANRVRVTLTPDREFVHDDGVKYPVTIDPYLIGLGASQDMYVAEADNKQYNTSTLAVGYSSSLGRSRAYLRFPVYLPGDVQVGGAQMGVTQYGGYCNAYRQIRLYSLATRWVFDSLGTGLSGTTWATQPPLDRLWATNDKTTCTTSDTVQFYGLGALVDQWRREATAPHLADNNNGVALLSSSEYDANYRALYYSLDYSFGNRAPYLDAYYNTRPYVPSSLQPAAGTRVRNTSVTLSAVVNDADGLDRLTPSFELRRVGATEVVKGDGNTVLPGNRSSWSYHNLLPGYSYEWRITNVDDADSRVSNQRSTPTGWQALSVNNRPNVPSLQAPANGHIAASSPALSAYYSDPDGDGGYVDFRVVYDDGPYVGYEAANYGSGYTGSGNTATVSTALGHGRYRWQTRAYDGDLYSEPQWRDTRYFTVNNRPDVPVLQSPADGYVACDTQSTLAALYRDADGDAGEVDFDVLNGAGQVVQQGSVAAASGSTASWRTPVMTEGKYRWRAGARDGYQSSSPSRSTERAISFDVTAPPVPSVSSSTHPDQTKPYNSRTFSASWPEPADTGGIAQYAVAVDQVAGTTPTQVQPASVRTYSQTVTADGTWYFHVRAQDKCDRWGDSAHFKFTVDTVSPGAPEVSSPTHDDPDKWYPTGAATFEWTEPFDVSGIDGYSYLLDREPLTRPDTTSEGTAQQKSYPDDDTVSPNGDNWFHVAARDGASNWSDPGHRRVRVDREPPVAPATVTSTTHPAAFEQVAIASSNRKATVAWTPGTDGVSGVGGYKYVFNQSRDIRPDAVATTPADQLQATSQELDDGVWYFHVVTVDNAGNVSTEDRVYGPIVVDEDSSPYGTPTLSNRPVAESDEHGLEQFYAYEDFDLGTANGYTQLRTGNTVVQQDLATVPGQGLNTVLRMTYNNRRAELAGDGFGEAPGLNDGAGRGWNLSVSDVEAGLEGFDGLVDGVVADLDANAVIVPQDIGTIVTAVVDGVTKETFQATGRLLSLTDGDGTTHRFAREGAIGSRWQSPPGVSLRVFEDTRQVVNAAGETVDVVEAYRLVRPDGVTYTAKLVDGDNVAGVGVHWRVVSVGDRRGNLLSYRYADVDQNVLTTEPRFRLVGIFHNQAGDQPGAASREVVRLSYDDQTANLTSVTTLPAGSEARTININVDEATHELRAVDENAHLDATDPSRRATRYAYLDDGRLSTVTDARDNVSTLTYESGPDGLGRLVALQDRELAVWTWAYDNPDPQTGEQRTTATTPLGALSATVYKTSGREPVNVAEARAESRAVDPDDNDRRTTGGNILSITDAGTPAGKVKTRFTWRMNRLETEVRVKSEVDSENYETRKSYDDIGMLIKVVQPPPNIPDTAGLPANAPTHNIVHRIRYGYPTSGGTGGDEFGYDQGCVTPPRDEGATITTDGYCRAVAQMVRTTFADNAQAPDQRRVTDFVYDDTGNMTRTVERKTPVTHDGALSTGTTVDPADARVTRFAYYDRGGLASINGPRTDVADVTCYGVLADAADCTGGLLTGVDAAAREYGGYDVTGMPTKVRDARGKTKEYRYSGYGMTLSVTDRDGRTTDSFYDERDNLLEVRDPVERADNRSGTRYAYDANDNKVSETTPRGIKTTFHYDGMDRVERTTSPGATATAVVETKTTYFEDGTTKTEDGPRPGDSDVTTYAYHPNQLLAKVTRPAGSNNVAVTDYTYDKLGRKATETSPAVNLSQRPKVTFTYTPQGDEARTAATSSSGQQDRITDVAFNAHGEPVQTLGPRKVNDNRAEKRQEYDAFGQTTKSSRRRSDGVFVDTQMFYDLAGNQIRTRQPVRKRTSNTGSQPYLESVYTFDAVNQLFKQTQDPVNVDHTVEYAYSGEGQQLKRTDLVAGELFRVTTYTYNDDNTRASSSVQDYRPDPQPRLWTCNSKADGTTGYDLDGNLLVTRTVQGASCAAGTLLREQTMRYDNRDFMVETTQRVKSPVDGVGLISRTQEFSYDDDGAKNSVTHNNKETLYTNSPAGWPEKIEDWRGKSTVMEYYPSGAPRVQRLGGATATTSDVNGTFGYRADGMIASLVWYRPNGEAIRRHTGITYDVGGLRTGEIVEIRKANTDGVTSDTKSGTATFEYDLMDRLQRWVSPFDYSTTVSDKPTTTYDLDDGGNILVQETKTGSGLLETTREKITANYVQGQLRSRTIESNPGGGVTSSATESFRYDGMGQETSRDETVTTNLFAEDIDGGSATQTKVDTATRTGYDAMGHTASVTEKATQTAGPELVLPGAKDVSYVYDTADRLLSRTQTKSDNTKTHTVFFYWGDTGVLAEEVDGRTGASKVRYLADGDGQNIAQQSVELDALGSPRSGTSVKWVWLLPDAVASVGTLLGSDGKVVEQKAYDPYGKPEPGGSDRKDTADDGSDNPKSTLGFQAAHTDDTTGRVLLGERQYDPTTARFTTPDVYVAGELDLELGTDELTGNRYLFAAANPVAFFEDGHGLFTTLGNIAKAAVPYIPVVGTAVDLVSAATGRDLLDGGRKLTGAERAMMLGTAALSMVPGAGTAAKAGVRAAADVARGAAKARPIQKVAAAASSAGRGIGRRLGDETGAIGWDFSSKRLKQGLVYKGKRFGIKVAYDGKVHEWNKWYFWGKWRHIQVNTWRPGKSGKGRVMRIPIARGPAKRYRQSGPGRSSSSGSSSTGGGSRPWAE